MNLFGNRLSTWIDADTKSAFTRICADMGLSTSQATKLFAKAVINHGGIPFALKAKQPNETTAAAIAELEAGQAYFARDVEELFSDLNIAKPDIEPVSPNLARIGTHSELLR